MFYFIICIFLRR